jgi:hypothetical protein
LSIGLAWSASLENTRPSVVVVSGGAIVAAAGTIRFSSADAGPEIVNARATADVASKNLCIKPDSGLPNSTQLPAELFLAARNMGILPFSGYARVRGSSVRRAVAPRFTGIG